MFNLSSLFSSKGNRHGLSDEIFKLPLYKLMRFTETEIREGEAWFDSIKDDELALASLALVYREYHPRLGQKSVYEFYGTFPNKRKVAIINLAQNGNGHYRDNAVTENLYNKRINSQGTELKEQEFYDLNHQWLLLEKEPRVKEKLADSFIHYTKLRPEAKTILLGLVKKDRVVAKSLLSWLRTYFADMNEGHRSQWDGEFAKQAMIEIEQNKEWDNLFPEPEFNDAIKRRDIRKTLGLKTPPGGIWFDEIENYKNYSIALLEELKAEGVQIEILATHMDEHPRSDYYDNPRQQTTVRLNGIEFNLNGPFITDEKHHFLCCKMVGPMILNENGLIVLDLKTSALYPIIMDDGKIIAEPATPFEYRNGEFIVLLGNGKLEYKDGLRINVSNPGEITMSPYEEK